MIGPRPQQVHHDLAIAVDALAVPRERTRPKTAAPGVVVARAAAADVAAERVERGATVCR